VVAVAGGSQVSLSWAANDEPDFATYTVYRATTPGGYGSALAVGLSSSTYVDDTAENDTTYYYVVRANDYTGNESPNSIEVSATPELDFVPPAAPTGLAATAGDQVVTLSWNENSEIDLDSYKVYRSTTSSNYASTALATVSTNTYVDDTVENGETYYYAVAAVDTSDNESTKSIEASATPADMTPAAPTGLSATPGDGSVALNWEENAGDNPVTYSVYRSTDSGSYSSVLTNGLTSTNYLDNTAVNGTTYYYVIRAVTAGIYDYESLLSQEVSATPVEPNTKVVGYYSFSGKSKTSSDSDTNSVAGDMVVGAGITTFKWETRGFWSPTQPSAYFEAKTDVSDATVLDDDYFSFTITPETDVTLDFESISFVDRSGGFFASVASDQDSFATVIDEVDAAGSWTNVNTLDLSSLSSATGATEIRLYFHNGSGAQVIDNITILAAPVSDEPPSEDTIPPASPTGLDATAGNGSVSLDWNDNGEGDMGTYSIYRSTISGNYGPALVTGLESSDYVDNTALSGSTYFYVISATDTNGNESTRSAEVSATPNASATEGYDRWASDHGVGAGSADDDSDGMNNLYEYAMGGNPTNPAMHGTLPVFSKSAKGFVYVYPQRSNDTGLTYTVETTTNLISGSWSNTGYTVTGTNVTGETLNFVTNDVSTVENDTFIRLKIEQ
jgi:fibronectin type 3 domain-containing protein